MTVQKLGQALVRIEDLTGLPDDMEERMQSQRVLYLARTERMVGIIHPPLVRKRDLKIIAGRDRIAARMVNGHEDILVEYARMSAREMEQVEEIENAFRRHDQAAQDRAIQRMFQDTLEEEEVLEKIDDRKKGPGRPSTPKGRAVKRVAEAAGVSVDTVQRKIAKQDEEPKAPPIHTWGLEVDEKWLEGVRTVQVHLGEVRAKVRRCTVVLSTLIDDEDLPIPTAVLSRKREELRQMASDLKATYPENLCPHCKGVSVVTENCGHCRGAGWVGKVDKGIDAKLTDEDEPHVWFRGAVVPLESVLDEGYEEDEVDF